jgi:hypothetical protein
MVVALDRRTVLVSALLAAAAGPAAHRKRSRYASLKAFPPATSFTNW